MCFWANWAVLSDPPSNSPKVNMTVASLRCSLACGDSEALIGLVLCRVDGIHLAAVSNSLVDSMPVVRIGQIIRCLNPVPDSRLRIPDDLDA